MNLNQTHQHGVTIIEIAMVLTILGIIVTVAVPSMSTFYDKKYVVAAGEDIYASLQHARSESIARSSDVYVEFTTTGGTWAYGISTNANCDLTKIDPTEANANACVLVVDDGDGVLDTGNATTDAADLILYRFTNDDYPGVSLTLDSITNNDVQFSSTRGTAEVSQLTLTSSEGYRMRIIVGVLGQIRLCSPAGNGNISGYSSNGC